eukprot:maker-scaffold70_size417918-snap-gene-3.15 protein:Tk01881 transcript:maker-scaffold70_size417918-snap-gene-3.15-mRNA-1 annotation:"solute carrier family 25 (mitochondrial carrier dicarboxylate transporter) member isoform cra_a"
MGVNVLDLVSGLLIWAVELILRLLVFQTTSSMSASGTPSSSGPSPVEVKRLGKWYFGGMASAAAACCTHPLDLVKVHMQTGGASEKIGMVSQTVKIIKGEGFLGLYNGLSASLLRQLTYSTTRFAIYEVSKQQVSPNGEHIPFVTRLSMAAVAGFTGGIVGTPGDMINVRMQNDIKLPKAERRKTSARGHPRSDARFSSFKVADAQIRWSDGIPVISDRSTHEILSEILLLATKRIRSLRTP